VLDALVPAAPHRRTRVPGAASRTGASACPAGAVALVTTEAAATTTARARGPPATVIPGVPALTTVVPTLTAGVAATVTVIAGVPALATVVATLTT